jgi:hypothetical protein
VSLLTPNLRQWSVFTRPNYLISKQATRVQRPGATIPIAGGADRDRTGDPLVANQVLSQLSYSPIQLPVASVELPVFLTTSH